MADAVAARGPWSHPPALPGPGVIHLWWLALPDCPELESLLAPSERTRAQRFHHVHDRQRYTAAHGALRTILAAYLEAEPGALAFATGATGKPALDPQAHGPRTPAFNLSHSGDHAVLAVARDGAVGVDIEVPRARTARAMMLDLLAPRERAAAATLDDAALARAFHIAWTRKEACLKAVGSGFAVPPRDIEAGLEPAAGVVHLPPAGNAAAADAAQAVHVLTLLSPAGVPTSVARLGAPVGQLQTFCFPAAADPGGAP